jgi:hypothetical protein
VPVFEEWIAIKATPDAVERCLTDPNLMERWMSPLQMIEPREGPWMQTGSTMRLRLKTLGMPHVDYTVVERVPGRLIIRLDGFLVGTYARRWFADGDTTVLLARVDYVVPNEGLRPFFTYLGQLFAQFDLRIELDRIRRLLETGSPELATQVV